MCSKKRGTEIFLKILKPNPYIIRLINEKELRGG